MYFTIYTLFSLWFKLSKAISMIILFLFSNGSTTILATMNTMKNDSNYSLDTHDTVGTMDMDENDYYNENDNNDNNNHNNNNGVIDLSGNNNNNGNNNNTQSMDNNNGSPDMQMDEFNMIGFNDDFTTLGVMGALSRNSSDSFNGMINSGAALNLNSAFGDNFSAFK